MATNNKISAAEMAASVGVDLEAYKAALRSAGLAWHKQGAAWAVERGSLQHDDMKSVMVNLLKTMREARRA
jgi:hypothetical protein